MNNKLRRANLPQIEPVTMYCSHRLNAKVEALPVLL